MKTSLSQIKSVLWSCKQKLNLGNSSEDEALRIGLNDSIDSIKELSGDQWNRINKILEEE